MRYGQNHFHNSFPTNSLLNRQPDASYWEREADRMLSCLTEEECRQLLPDLSTKTWRDIYETTKNLITSQPELKARLDEKEAREYLSVLTPEEKVALLPREVEAQGWAAIRDHLELRFLARQHRDLRMRWCKLVTSS